MEHQDQPTFKIPNVVRQYATDILLKYPDITITEMEKFLRNKFQLDLTKDQIRYAAYQLMLKPNGESLMKENEKYDYNLISKGSNKWIIQVKYGTKVVDEQLFTGTETEARYKGEKNVDYFEVRHKPGMNSKGYYESIIEQKNQRIDTESLSREAKRKLIAGMEFADVVDWLEKEHHLTRSVAYSIADKGKRMREIGNEKTNGNNVWHGDAVWVDKYDGSDRYEEAWIDKEDDGTYSFYVTDGPQGSNFKSQSEAMQALKRRLIDLDKHHKLRI